MKILRILLLVVVLLSAGVGLALIATRPDPLPEGSESARRLEPGPHAVALTEAVWIDASRATAANGDFEGAPERSFDVSIWSPEGASGPHPLLVFSHGFMSTKEGCTAYAEHLASHGYVVLAASYPLTNFMAPGGPNADDVVQQPADVSFLIDRALSLGPDERAFAGGIDRDRIGVFGISLGGLTTTLVAYHPQLGDPRIQAALSIAGPGVMFGPDYFDFADVPFLMVAGTHDAMIQYGPNAEPIPGRIRRGGLVTLDGASHAGFSYLAAGPMRLLGNPDEIGCEALTRNLDLAPGENPFSELGGPEQGMIDASGTPLPCEIRFEEAISAGRQQWLTALAVEAFFGSYFADDPKVRSAHAEYLAKTLPEELPEVRYTPASRS